MYCIFFFSSRRRHTRCALVTGVQTCALPISTRHALRIEFRRNRDKSLAQPAMAWVRVVAVVPVHHLFNIRQRVGGLNCTDRCMTSEQFGSPLEDQGGKPRPLNQERYEQKAFDGDFDPPRNSKLR